MFNTKQNIIVSQKLVRFVMRELCFCNNYAVWKWVNLYYIFRNNIRTSKTVVIISRLKLDAKVQTTGYKTLKSVHILKHFSVY